MADSPDCGNSDEFVFLDKELLDMLNSKPQLDDFGNALKEISGSLLQQMETNENAKSRYMTLKEKIKTTSKENEKLRMDIANLKEEISMKEKELDKMSSRENKDLYRYECMLYHTITKIKWDMDCPENEVAGVIGEKTISTFQLDSNKHSKAFITNHLWNLIGNAE